MVNSGDLLAILNRVKELGYRRFRLKTTDAVIEVDTQSTGDFISSANDAAPPELIMTELTYCDVRKILALIDAWPDGRIHVLDGSLSLDAITNRKVEPSA